MAAAGRHLCDKRQLGSQRSAHLRLVAVDEGRRDVHERTQLRQARCQVQHLCRGLQWQEARKVLPMKECRLPPYQARQMPVMTARLHLCRRLF